MPQKSHVFKCLELIWFVLKDSPNSIVYYLVDENLAVTVVCVFYGGRDIEKIINPNKYILMGLLHKALFFIKNCNESGISPSNI